MWAIVFHNQNGAVLVVAVSCECSGLSPVAVGQASAWLDVRLVLLQRRLAVRAVW